ncbi:TonB-dependent receptor [Caulobacter sp. KR2-114]|uniref:TonB-dependent receptor n=1 Tax=Caulobacter sp. KR2-114 TaxID=3400912 RepID=UPI003BFC8B7D
MTSRAHRRFGAISTLALLAAVDLAMAHPARAADAAADAASSTESSTVAAAGTLSEVVVTAARRQQTALSTPISISAVTGNDLEKAGVKDFRDLSRTVPGLVYNGGSIRSGGATNNFVLHGLNLDDVSNSGDQPLPTVAPVSVYVDETPSFVNLKLADVQRVEVLRGPQGTLYGVASIAGTVRVLFNQPDPSKFSAELSGEVSDTKHASGPNYSLDGVINAPLNADTAFRLAAGYEFDNGFINAPHLFQLDANGAPVLANPADPIHSLPVSTSKKDIDDASVWYVRPMLKYEHDKFSVLFTYQHQHEHADGDDVDSYPGGPAPTAYSSTGDPNSSPGFQNDGFDAAFPSTFRQYESGQFLLTPYNRDVDLASVEASYDLGFATLTSVTSWYQNTSQATSDSSGFYQASLGFLYEGYPRLMLASHRHYTDHAAIEEVRLVSKSSGRLNWSVGAFYMNQTNHLLQDDVIPGFADYSAALGVPTGTDLAYQYDRHIHFEDLAFFGEATYHVTPKWQVTGGVRVYRQDLDLNSTIELPICGVFCSNDGVNPLGLSGGGSREIVTKALFKANTSYQITDSLLAFATYSQGERRGGANGVPTQGILGASPEFLFFKPDTVDNYEVGLKGRLGGRFQFSGAFYWIEWHDPQVNVSTPVGAFPAVVNGDRARSRGVDLEAKAQVTDDIVLSATYSYNKAELLDAIVVGGVSYGAAGTRLPGTPANTLSFGADYEHPVLNGLTLTLHGDVSYRSGMTTSLTPSINTNLPGFAILNASIGVSKGPMRVSLFANNITNERGVLSSNNVASYDVRAIDNRLSRPLTVGLRFGYKY